MPKRGGKRKKARTHKPVDDSGKQVPGAFVIKRGKPTAAICDLVKDFRNVMMPNCAKKLKESKKNKTADFVGVASGLGMTHLCAFHSTSSGSYMKIGRMPRGPTLTFKIQEFSLSSDVKNAQKRPRSSVQDFNYAPLLVMNGCSGSDLPPKMISQTIKGMFETIDVRTFKNQNCKRAALFNYNQENGELEFRHYAIVQKAAQLSRGVRKLLRSNRKINMSRSEDIADYVQNGGYPSDSEMEDNVPVGVKNDHNQNIAINMVEIGPRMKLKLVCIQDDVCGGKVLYSKKAERTEEEVAAFEKREAAKVGLATKLAEDKAERKLKRRELRAKKEANLMKELEALSDDEEDEAKEEDENTAPKRKHFHPFAWARKAAEKADKTVEMNDEPSERQAVKKVTKMKKPEGKKVKVLKKKITKKGKKPGKKSK